VTAYTLVKDEYTWDASGLYGPDRHEGMATGTAVSAGTWGQSVTATAGSSGYAFKFAGVTLTGTGILYHRYRMEALDAVRFKNQSASFSVSVHHDVGSAINYTIYVRKADTANNFSAVTAISNSGAISVPSATKTLLKYENISMGDCSNGIEIEIKIECGAVTTKNFEQTELQFEKGPVATAFEFQPYATTLQHCMHYAEILYPGVSSAAIVTGTAVSTTAWYAAFRFVVTKRAAPTIAYGGSFQIRDASGNVAITGINFLNIHSKGCTLNVAGTFTAGNSGFLRTVAAEGYILISSEL
jgi:hypothetical protein